MDTTFLESFVMVVEYGSVAEAARHLNLTRRERNVCELWKWSLENRWW